MPGCSLSACAALKRLEPSRCIGRQPSPLAGIDLCSLEPLAQRLLRASDLRRDLHDHRPARRVFVFMIEDQANYAAANLRRELVARIAYGGSTFSGVGASGKPRAVHWKSFKAVAYKILEWLDWFNHQRLLEAIGNIRLAEAEANFCAALENIKLAAYDSSNRAFEELRVVQ